MTKPERGKLVVLDYKRGLPLKKVMEKWKISMGLIYYYLNKVETPKRVHHYTIEEAQRMMDDYKAGVPLKEIGRRFNISESSVYHILKRRCFIFTRNGNRKIEEGDLENISELYKKGLSTQQIAEKYGVTKSRIGYWLKKQGVILKTPNEWNKSRRKKIKPQCGMTKDKAIFFGLLLSDGSESKKANNITFAGKDKFVDNFSIKLVEKIYGIKGREDNKQRRIVWYSESMRDDLHLYVPTIVHSPQTETHIPKEIVNNEKFHRAFLKAYFSCDGSVTICIGKDGRISRNVSVLSRNLNLADDIGIILSKLKIRYTNNKGVVQIGTQEGLKCFKEKIGFFPVLIQKGKNWRGCTKDKLLELVILSLSKDFKKSFRNKEEGYSYLMNLYESL